MITIKGQIDVNATGTSSKATIVSVNIDGNRNNISARIGDVFGKKSAKVGNPFILGSSKLGSGATYANSLPYFMSRELSDSNGDFSSAPFKFMVYGVTGGLSISFDTTNGGFPKSVKVNGQTFVDDDAVWEIADIKDKNLVFEIYGWNKPNSPLIITGIDILGNIEIDKSNLISYTNNLSSVGDIQRPYYGIYSNGANLTIADQDEQILDLIRQDIMQSGLFVTTTLVNDNIEGLSEQIGEVTIDDIVYNNDNRQVELSLKDRLVQLQNLDNDGSNYIPTITPPATAKELYDYLYTKTSALGYNILTFDELDTDTQDVLNDTTIEYPLLESSNLSLQWDKLSELCLANIYVNKNRQMVFKVNK